MATASTTLVMALVAVALGNLQMIDALINPCVTFDTGDTKLDLIGKWGLELDLVNIPMNFMKYAVLIPSKEACPAPIGVSTTVCIYPASNVPKPPPQLTYVSFNEAFLKLHYNNDPLREGTLKVTVICVGVPSDYPKPKVTLEPLVG